MKDEASEFDLSLRHPDCNVLKRIFTERAWYVLKNALNMPSHDMRDDSSVDEPLVTRVSHQRMSLFEQTLSYYTTRDKTENKEDHRPWMWIINRGCESRWCLDDG